MRHINIQRQVYQGGRGVGARRSHRRREASEPHPRSWNLRQGNPLYGGTRILAALETPLLHERCDASLCIPPFSTLPRVVCVCVWETSAKDKPWDQGRVVAWY